jgi:hypothetical protein
MTDKKNGKAIRDEMGKEIKTWKRLQDKSKHYFTCDL